MEETGHTVHSFTVNYSAASDREFQSTLQDGLEVYQDPETGKWCLGKEGCEPICETEEFVRLRMNSRHCVTLAGANEQHYQELLAQGEEKLDAGAKQWMENHDKEMAEKWGLTREDGKLYNPEQLNELRITKNYGSVLPSALGGEQVEVPEAFANTEHELRKVDDELTICWDKENGWSVRGLPNETGDNNDLNNDPIVKAYNAIQNKEDLTSFEKEFIKYADDRFKEVGISFDNEHKVVIANNEELGVPYQQTSMMANPSQDYAEAQQPEAQAQQPEAQAQQPEAQAQQPEAQAQQPEAQAQQPEVTGNGAGANKDRHISELRNGVNKNFEEASTTKTGKENGTNPDLKTNSAGSNNASNTKAVTGVNPMRIKNNSNYH